MVIAVALRVARDGRVLEAAVDHVRGKVGDHAAVHVDLLVPLVVARDDGRVLDALHADAGPGTGLAAVAADASEVVARDRGEVVAGQAEVGVAAEADLIDTC